MIFYLYSPYLADVNSKSSNLREEFSDLPAGTRLGLDDLGRLIMYTHIASSIDGIGHDLEYGEQVDGQNNMGIHDPVGVVLDKIFGSDHENSRVVQVATARMERMVRDANGKLAPEGRLKLWSFNPSEHFSPNGEFKHPENVVGGLG